VITDTKTFSPSILATAIIAASTFSTSAIARGPDLPVELLGGSFTVDGLVKNGAERQLDGGNSLFLLGYFFLFFLFCDISANGLNAIKLARVVF